jgi:hypothetical protein
MKADSWRIRHLVFGFSVGTMVSYVLLSSPYVSNESAYMLIIFNFLFVSLIFSLNGTLKRKVSLLLVGDFIGLLWNQLFSTFAHAVAYHFGDFFNTSYIILSPFINLIWIVSFWSMSLTALTYSENRKGGLEN